MVTIYFPAYTAKFKLQDRVYLTNKISSGLGTVVGIHAPWSIGFVSVGVRYSVSWDRNRKTLNGPAMESEEELSKVI
jgi:hypothetical protein